MLILARRGHPINLDYFVILELVMCLDWSDSNKRRKIKEAIKEEKNQKGTKICIPKK